MSLDKKFLKYKLEKIKNDRIFKDQDTETKRRIRKENAKLATEESDAIHSYLTGEDNIDALDNKSYLENRLPGSLFLIPNKITRGNKKVWVGGLNIRQVQTNPKSKKTKLSRLLKKFRTIAKSNIDAAKQIIILKKIFDKLNIVFSSEEIKLDGKIEARGFKTNGEEGITEDFIVADMEAGIIIRKKIIVKNGLIVGQQKIN